MQKFSDEVMDIADLTDEEMAAGVANIMAHIPSHQLMAFSEALYQAVQKEVGDG